MNDYEFDLIVDKCLRRMRAEGYSAQQCLSHYPEHAVALRPLLEAAERLAVAQRVVPSRVFKAGARARLIEQAAARPRRAGFVWQPARHFAVPLSSLALMVVASTTAFAQSALPGEALYNWKLNSENVWWAVASDRVEVDLSLVERRATELTKVAHDPSLEATARDGLHRALTRLDAEAGEEDGAAVEEALLEHQENLWRAGLKDKQLDDMVEHGKKKK